MQFKVDELIVSAHHYPVLKSPYTFMATNKIASAGYLPRWVSERPNTADAIALITELEMALSPDPFSLFYEKRVGIPI